mgnify:CR=1 FL=1|jgi:hypothetical protein
MNQLTDADIIALKTLVPLANQIKQEAEYRAAQRLVLKTWRSSVIFLAGFIAAVFLLRNQIATLLGIK